VNLGDTPPALGQVGCSSTPAGTQLSQSAALASEPAHGVERLPILPTTADTKDGEVAGRRARGRE